MSDLIESLMEQREEALAERDAALAEAERLNARLHAPRPLKFIADDGDGEQLEFDTIEEARSCANEWIHVQYREAALTGEWSDVTEHIRILAEVERAHGEDVGEGVDFELGPTTTDERKEGGA
jgi:hypothetical protein